MSYTSPRNRPDSHCAAIVMSYHQINIIIIYGPHCLHCVMNQHRGVVPSDMLPAYRLVRRHYFRANIDPHNKSRKLWLSETLLTKEGPSWFLQWCHLPRFIETLTTFWRSMPEDDMCTTNKPQTNQSSKQKSENCSLNFPEIFPDLDTNVHDHFQHIARNITWRMKW